MYAKCFINPTLVVVKSSVFVIHTYKLDRALIYAGQSTPRFSEKHIKYAIQLGPAVFFLVAEYIIDFLESYQNIGYINIGHDIDVMSWWNVIVCVHETEKISKQIDALSVACTSIIILVHVSGNLIIRFWEIGELPK